VAKTTKINVILKNHLLYSWTLSSQTVGMIVISFNCVLYQNVEIHGPRVRDSNARMELYRSYTESALFVNP
jgi:hypothetical protein